MMTVKTLPTTLTLTLALLINPAQAESVDAEKAAIEAHGKQISYLQNSNDAIQKKMADLQSQIDKKAAQYGPEEKEFRAAEDRYQSTLKAAEDKPTKENLEAAESARFEFVMAERKYQRSTADVTKLRKEQQQLEKELARNNRKIGKTNALIDEQQQRIVAMEQEAREKASAQAYQERQLRLQQQGALKNSQSELTKTREEHAAAIAEITALKAMLAEKEAAAAAEAASQNSAAVSALGATTAITVAASTPAPALEEVTAPAVQQQIAQAPESPRDKYLQLMTLSEQNSARKHRVNKIIHVKTYKNNRLSKQTSHSLRHLGNGIYEGKTSVRAGSTSFVVGSRQWRREIPGDHHQEDYIFVLDTRDKSRQKLVLFAKAEVE